MAGEKVNDSLIVGKVWNNKFIIFSAIVVVVTGISILFFDHTDPSKFQPMNTAPPAYRDTNVINHPQPVRLLNTSDSAQ